MAKIIERQWKTDEWAWRNGGLILSGEFRTCMYTRMCVCARAHTHTFHHNMPKGRG